MVPRGYASTPASRRVDFFSFCKRVGVVTGAALGLFAVLSVLWSVAVASLIIPEINKAVAQERIARERGERELLYQMQQLSRDRVDFLNVLQAHAGSEREAVVRDLRLQWSRQQERSRLMGETPETP